MKGYTDIHCHSVMMHYRNPELNKTACEEINKMGISDALRSSNTQSDFGKLVNGGVGGIIISLYPIERKWLLPETDAPRLIAELVSRVTGFSINEVKRLMKEEEQGVLDYYKDLVGEYNYLRSQVNKPCNGKQIIIATNYAEFKENNKNSDKVCIVISIEGGHALGTILPDDLTKKPELVQIEDYNIKYRDNVFAMKKWGPNNDGSHTPLFITLGHHFWNMLVGHSESLPFLFDQKTGKESGFTDAGREMINDLLSSDDKHGTPNKTRKVLIDVKHMSPLARKQYYNHIDRIKRTTGLNTPVICSHASIGDAEKLNWFIEGTMEYDENKKSLKQFRNFFNTSTLSLNNEDVIRIIESDGLIGIILHEGRIAHKKAREKKAYRVTFLQNEIKNNRNDIERMQARLLTDISDNRKETLTRKIKNRHQKILDAQQEIREAFVSMIMANIYKIVEVYAAYNSDNKSRGWDHITIGSDFDGTINKMDYLGTAEEFPVLEEEIIKFMDNPKPLTGFSDIWTPDYLRTLHFNISPEELADKFMSSNTESFLKKYFTTDYLIHGINP